MTHGTAPAPDRSLVAGMAQGEQAALRELARRHGPSVYALAYAILVDGADADEVVAETFEYAWRTAAQFFERQPGADLPIAHVTSECDSPTLGKRIALAFAAPDACPEDFVRLGDSRFARVSRLPFYDPGKHLPRAAPL